MGDSASRRNRAAGAAERDWRRIAAVVGLATGLAIAVAANLAYAIPRGPVVIGIGLVAPLVLPPVLVIRSLFTVTGWWQRLCRETAMVAVAAPAVAVSYWHTYSLVLAAGEPASLALLVPLSSDGLAGMSTLALAALARGQTRVRGGRPAGKGGVESTRPGRVRRAHVTPPPPTRDTARDKAALWARARWLDGPVTVAQIQLGAGVSRRAATVARRQVAAEMERERAS